MLSLSGGLHGAYSRLELNRVLTPHALRAAVEHGWLASFSRHVLVDSRRATEFLTRAAASLLVTGPESVLTGHSALALHGCGAADPAPIHVLVPQHRKPRSREGLVIHRGRFEERDVEELGGLRVLALDAALAEVLCRGSRRAAIACADQVLAMVPENARTELRRRTWERIHDRPDTRGTLRGVALLDLATGLAESPPESWMLLALADGGLPAPQAQVKVTGILGNEIYRLDLAWPEPMVAVEYDGYASHENRKERDAARDEDLRRRGWIVIRADASDLKDPARVVAATRAALRSRGLAV